jgi:hypothetical protein
LEALRRHTGVDPAGPAKDDSYRSVFLEREIVREQIKLVEQQYSIAALNAAEERLQLHKSELDAAGLL